MSDLTFSAEEKRSFYNIDKHEFQWCTGSYMTIHWNAIVKKPKSCLMRGAIYSSYRKRVQVKSLIQF